MKNSYLDFGFNPQENKHHFVVTIPEKKESPVIIYEQFEWQARSEQQPVVLYNYDSAKAEISRHKWKLLEEAVKTEFNSRLKKQKKRIGRFNNGNNYLERMFGKELLVLVWAVEESDPSNIETAIRNWLGLAPEERWWLYTMTNAATGHLPDRRGWRKALRYALCENPVDEERQISFFETMLKRTEEDEADE